MQVPMYWTFAFFICATCELRSGCAKPTLLSKNTTLADGYFSKLFLIPFPQSFEEAVDPYAMTPTFLKPFCWAAYGRRCPMQPSQRAPTDPKKFFGPANSGLIFHTNVGIVGVEFARSV